MNPKRIIFWACFVVVLGLIVWGMVAAMEKAEKGPGASVGVPAPISASDHARGPLDAPVVIIEYSDFECPACQAYHSVIERLLASSTVPIRFAYRHFPLPQHKSAKPAAYASEAASMQGKFWEMYDLIFENPGDWVGREDANEVFVSYATRLGLDVAKFRSDMSSEAVLDAVSVDESEAVKLRLFQTPTFFVNGKLIDNPRSYEAFKTLVETSSR